MSCDHHLCVLSQYFDQNIKRNIKKKKIVLDMSTAAALLILLMAAPLVCGVDHIVGGNAGWSTVVNYYVWAAAQNFAVNDTLGKLFPNDKFFFGVLIDRVKKKYHIFFHLPIYMREQVSNQNMPRLLLVPITSTYAKSI